MNNVPNTLQKNVDKEKKTYMRGFIALANKLFFGLFAGLHINIDHFLVVSLEQIPHPICQFCVVREK